MASYESLLLKPVEIEGEGEREGGKGERERKGGVRESIDTAN